MKKWLITLCLFLLLVPCANSASMEEIGLSGPVCYLIEPESGQVLFAQGETKTRPIASITKVMTLMLAFEELDAGNLSLDDMVTISQNAASTEGSQAFLDAGESYSVRDLVRTIIIASANDSCVAMAEHLAGSEAAFVAKMNEKAKQLGLTDTVFMTCTGLPASGQFSTARDVALMACELLTHDVYFEFSTTWMDTLVHPSGRETELTNTNRLVRFYDGADGLKTGYSSEAGHCLCATAQRNGTRYIAVLLGYADSKTRFADAQCLLQYGFDHYEQKTIVKQGDVLVQGIPVEGGTGDVVDLAAAQDVRLLLPKGEEIDLSALTGVPERLHAPLYAGTVIAQATFTHQGQQITIPLTAAQTVEQNLFGRMLTILANWT